MKIIIVTVGKPKLTYAQAGWEEYLGRLQRHHSITTTQIADKHAYDASKINEAVQGSYTVVLEITGSQLSSEKLAAFLTLRELDAKPVSFVIGGPEGLPKEVIDSADYKLSFSKLTFPHDLAMVVLLEALYRASTINAGQPYHK